MLLHIPGDMTTVAKEGGEIEKTGEETKIRTNDKAGMRQLPTGDCFHEYDDINN